MLALVARSAVGMTVAPTIDYFRGEKVTVRDFLPFGHATQSGYDMNDFAKDLGYTAVGATIAATPYTTLVGTELLTGTTSIPFSSSAVIPVAVVTASVVGSKLIVDTTTTHGGQPHRTSFTGQMSGKYFDY